MHASDHAPPITPFIHINPSPPITQNEDEKPKKKRAKKAAAPKKEKKEAAAEGEEEEESPTKKKGPMVSPKSSTHLLFPSSFLLF